MRSGAVFLITRTLIDSSRSLGAHITLMGAVGGILSAFMNNVAALALLMPVDIQTTRKAGRKPGLSLMPPRFSPILGGMVTLSGTPPNIILAAQVRELFGVEISFASWMLIGVPVVITLLAIAWVYLGRVAFRMSIKGIPGGQALIQNQRNALGKISFEETAVAAVFAFAAFMWITRGFIWSDLVPEIRDGMIAVLAAVLLFLIPERTGNGGRILDWKDSREIPWGILLLFGGGLAIASGFRETGLATYMGEQLTVLDSLHLLVIIACATLLILFLTEITSNTATATMILPVVAALALALNIHPFALMVPCAMAANCAFMLPAGTPPNAIIFATEKLRIVKMVPHGFVMNILDATIIGFVVYLLMTFLWNLQISH